MIRSLQARLVIGMLLGMVAVLAAVGGGVYSLLHRQAYARLDDALVDALTAITPHLHAEPGRVVFAAQALQQLLERDPRDQLYYQVWSDDLTATQQQQRRRPGDRWLDWLVDGPDDPGPGGEFGPGGDLGPGGDPGPPGGPFGPEFWLGDEEFAEQDEPGDSAGDRPTQPQRFWPIRRGESTDDVEPMVVRSASLGDTDLPRLNTSTREPRFTTVTLPDGSPGRAVGKTIPLPPPGLEGPGGRLRVRYRADVTITVAASTLAVEQRLQELARLMFAGGLAGVLLAVGVALLVTRQGLTPLRRVARQIADIDADGLHRRVADPGVPREVAPMVAQLNGLLERMEEAFARERTLTANVAHELRTPLAGLRTVAEITLGKPRPADEYIEALTETLGMTDQMQGIVEKLLMLARLETGQVQPALEDVPAKLALEAQWAAGPAARAAERSVTLALDVPADCTVRADTGLFDVVLANVLGNAAAYATPGSAVQVQARRAGPLVELELTNACTGLSAEAVANVFDRFWRADEARGAEGLHCGLGLTLVRRALRAQGGDATATLTGDGRFCLLLTLPAA